ncbi:MAG: hypothetical protein AB8B93_15180 [Pseudomonadales bacterium]
MGTTAAHGSLTDARTSSDSIQEIGCKISAYDDGDIFVTCRAVAADGRVKTCFLAKPTLQKLLVISGINASSVLHFEHYDKESNTCDVIQIDNGSGYL